MTVYDYKCIIEVEITNPLQLQTYSAVLDYKAAGKGQINLSAGDQVDVIDKNENGKYVCVSDCM